MNVLKVDLRDPEAPQKFALSLKETGFAVITNHGVPEAILNEVYAQWAAFFATEEKHGYLMREDHSGYFPFKSENAKGASAKDLKEFFHLYDGSDLPGEMPGLQTLLIKDSMTDLGARLLTFLQDYLPEHVRRDLSMPLPDMIIGSEKNLLRILHYPPLENVGEGEVRAAAHEDINLITLLPAATNPGLQVRDVRGFWYEVESDPGSIIVNAGDMLELATSAYYKSTTHRVVNPEGDAARQSRYSMPLFVHPRPEVILAQGITAESYLNQRLKEIGLK